MTDYKEDFGSLEKNVGDLFAEQNIESVTLS